MRKTQRVISLLFLVLLCGARQLLAQEADTAKEEAIRKLQSTLDDLRSQMNRVQSELDALRGAKPPPPPTGSIVSAPPPHPLQLSPQQQEEAAGKATRDRHTFAEDEADAPRLYNAPLEPTYPGFFLLPGTHTLLRLNGSARTDLIYDPRTTALSELFIPSAIPIPSPSGSGNFMASVRGSRAMADFLIPVGEGAARTFIQVDFFGSNGSTAPRLRHFYAQLDNILVGQTFTNFMDPDAFEDALDNQGVNAAINLRPPQVRYSFGLGGGASAYVSLENPASEIDFSVAGTPATPTTPAPDVTLRFRNEWELGHIQVAGVFRDLGVRLPDGAHQSTFGWGVNATGGLEVFGRDNIVLGLAYGHGISRYVGDSGGLDLDAAPISATNLSLRALPLFATYGSYQHYWSPALRSSATLGFMQVDNTDFQSDHTYHKSTYSAVNLIWNPVGTLDVGAEFLYGWVTEKSGAHASEPRIQITGRYTFVKLHPEGAP
jgi:hypothetical protein